MSYDLPPYDLGLSAEAAAERFAALQRKLVPLWTSIKALSDDEQTIVVVPSLSVDVILRPSEVQAYEERFLFLLLLLRQPRARLIYVTSQPVNPDIIDYYLGLMPGIIASHARRRPSWCRRWMARRGRSASSCSSGRTSSPSCAA